MNKMLLRGISLLFLIPLAGHMVAQEMPGLGRITFTSPSERLAVTINDTVFIVQQPFVYQRPQGIYTIRVTDAMDYHAVEWDTAITLIAGEDIRLIYRQKHRIRFRSNPYGAEVRAGGVLLGYTPFTYAWIKTENESVLFSKKGYKDKQVFVTDSAIQINAELEPLRKPSASVFTTSAHRSNFREANRTPLWVSMALCVAAGSATAYYKNRADKYFEKAKTAAYYGDEEAIDYYRAKTRRYDRRALYGYISMGVTFTASMYFLFSIKD